MKNIITIILAIFFIQTIGLSQDPSTLNEALENGDFFYYAEDYTEAVFHYQRLVDSDLMNSNIQFKIGVCFLNISGEEYKGIPFLEEASKNTTEKYKKRSPKEESAPEYALFYLGNAYRINNELDKALDTYTKFMGIPDFENKFNKTIVDNEIKSCEKAKIIQDIPINVKITNLEEPINSGVANYHPATSADGNMLVFMSELKFYNGIFISQKENGVWSEPLNINPQVGSDGDVVPCAVSTDKKEIYLVKGEDDDRDIYISRFDGTFWTKMEPLNANINSVRAESYASISTDGQTLYFSSNRRGSIGEFDIYKSKREANGYWGPAENLGNVINTEYAEEYPNINQDGKILYFSSQSHYNMGGFDVFYSGLNEDGGWNTPVNIGYPVNTTGDDICYAPVGNGSIAFMPKILVEGKGKEDIYYIETFPEEKTEFMPVEGLIDTKGLNLNFDSSFDIHIIDVSSKQVIGTIHFNKETGKLSYSVKTGNLEFEFKDKKQ